MPTTSSVATTRSPIGLLNYTNGEVGQAFSLTGSNYISVPDAPALNPTNAITVECWLYRRAAVGSWDPVVKKNGTIGGGTGNGYSLEFNGNNILFWIYSSNGGWCSSGGTVPIQLGQWYHFAGVYDWGASPGLHQWPIGGICFSVREHNSHP